MLPLHGGSKLGQAGFIADYIVGNAAALLAACLNGKNAFNHITGEAAAFNGTADLRFFTAINNEDALENALKNRLLGKQGDFDDAVGGLGILLLLRADFGENQRMEDVFKLGFGLGGLKDELAQDGAVEAT